jgi:dTDP-4-dehydrorhamnose reductase
MIRDFTENIRRVLRLFESPNFVNQFSRGPHRTGCHANSDIVDNMTVVRKVKLLVTGASGYLGQHLLSSLVKDTSYDLTVAYGSLESFPHDCKNTFSKNDSTLKIVDGTVLDWSDESCVQAFFLEHTFDVIIHLAAISSPYRCEHDTDKTASINCPTKFISALTQKDICERTKDIHLSTDQIYDGFNAPYVEDDKASPVNFYGKSKLDFEQLLLNADRAKIQPIILRSSLILGGVTPGTCRKQSFLQFVKDRLLNQQETDFYSNEYRNVVFVGDVVKIIEFFVQCKDDISNPVFNMGGGDRVSRVEIAAEVAKVLELDPKYIKDTERAPMVPLNAPKHDDEIIVRSPPDISMDIKKIQKVTGRTMLGLESIVRQSLKD